MWTYRQIDFHRINDYNEYSDYLTNWADTLNLFYLTYSTVLILLTYNSYDKLEEKAPWYYYISQLLLELAMTVAILITAVNFGLLSNTNSVGNTHAHVMNGKSQLFIKKTKPQ